MKAILTEAPFGLVNESEQIEDDGSSSVFGSAFLPEDWLIKNEFSPYEFYVGRISADAFDCEIRQKCEKLRQKNAYLYFFVECAGFNFSKLKARVRCFCGEADACTEFNEGFFEEEEIAYKLTPSALGDGEALVFEESAGEVILLSLPSTVLPFEIKGDNLQFYIAEKDFSNGLFEQCKIRTV